MYFFLSGLRWHIPGLSELPPQQRLLLLLVGDSLFSSSFCSRRRAFFFQLSTSCDLLFCTYEHVIVEHLPRAQPSTAHQSCTKQQEQVHDRSERDNASRKTALARASTPSSIYTQLAAFSKRTKESKSARPTPAYIQESFFRPAALVICESSVCSKNRGLSCPLSSIFFVLSSRRERRSAYEEAPRTTHKRYANLFPFLCFALEIALSPVISWDSERVAATRYFLVHRHGGNGGVGNEGRTETARRAKAARSHPSGERT